MWRTLNTGPIGIRLVECTQGYATDHWCDREHILYVIEGKLVTEFNDGRRFALTPA